MRRFGLRDDQWDRIKNLLPGREGSVGVTAADNRLFVEAVLYRYAMARSADTLIANKAFDAEARVLEPLAAAGKTAVIPPRTNRSSPRDYDREIYGARHLIENFFAKIKQFRAIATRYEKTARNFLAGVQLVASVVWLN